MTKRRRVNKPAELPPITGQYVAIAKKLRDELGWDESDAPYQSSREAARRTGLHYLTVLNLATGARVTHRTIMKLSEVYGWPLNDALKLANLDPVKPDTPSISSEDPETVREFVNENFPDFDEGGKQEIVDTILRNAPKSKH